MMQNKFVNYLIVIAALLALGTIAAILVVRNRNAGATTAETAVAPIDTAAGTASQAVTYQVTVMDVPVNLQVIPEEQVQLVPLAVPIAPVVEQPAADITTEQPTPEPVIVADQPTAEPVVVEQPTPEPVIIADQPTAVPPPPAVTGSANFAAEEIIFTNYVVQQEDTLYRLTEKFNTSIELMARFTIASDDFVVGNTLSVPIANPDRCPGMRPYVVREHETVYRIATAFGTTPPTVQSINGLDANYSIRTTQVLCLP